MPYIFKQKINLQDLVPTENRIVKILIYEPEEYLAGLYRLYMHPYNFHIKHCLEVTELLGNLAVFEPELLIYNADTGKNFLLNKTLFKNYPSLKIITTAYNISHEQVRKLMDHGVSSHINRRFSRPADVATLVATVLNH